MARMSFGVFGRRAAVGLAATIMFAFGIALPAEANVFSQNYVVIGWNDFGMYRMQKDNSALCLAPPSNNFMAQVVLRGNPPQLVTSGVTLTYSIPGNTISSSKINFWTYVNPLFGVSPGLDKSLTGLGLTGAMTLSGTAYQAIGVPLTPFTDAAPTVEQPYQYAQIVLKSGATTLDTTQFVAPVSAEIRCDKCHSGTPTFWDDILKKHDSDHSTNFEATKPILCANCHASALLGKPGIGIKSFSQAVHGFHGGITNTCYDCHPGPIAHADRGAMFLAGKTCQDCHGSVAQIASTIATGRRPWVDEPKCSTCHPSQPENTGKLYHQSTDHGGLYCEACHNSTHAELPSSQARDSVQVSRLQDRTTFIRTCKVCHTVQPTSNGPHGIRPTNAASPHSWQQLD